MNQMVPCPQCGAPLRVGERFCGNCGTGLSWPSQQQPPPYQQSPPPYQPPQYQGYQQPPGWGQPPPPPPGWIPPQQPPGWGPQYGQQRRFAGTPPGKQNSSNLILILSIVLIIILAVGGIGIATNGTFKFGSTPTSSPSASTPSSTSPATSPSDSSADDTTTTPAPASISVTADKLIADYNENAETAKTTYKDKVVTVSGKVDTLDASAFSVTLKGDTSEDFYIDCFFSSGDQSKISNLEPDQAVNIKGTVGDYAAGLLQITGCTFVN